MTAALKIEALTVRTPQTELVRDVSLTVQEGEIVGLVGESGSGKSLTALSIAGLLPPWLTCEVRGEFRLGTIDVRALSARQRNAMRGTAVSMVFQEPTTALNPVLSIRRQLIELFELECQGTAASLRRKAAELLRTVQLDEPERVLDAYPFELSGGMKQRVLIAMAIARGARLLIADEPTTALDVLVQAEILRLLQKLARETSIGILLISHNLGVVRAICERINVMQGGSIVETGRCEEVLAAPCHAYTRLLIDSIPENLAARRRP